MTTSPSVTRRIARVLLLAIGALGPAISSSAAQEGVIGPDARHAEVAELLTSFIEREMRDKRIPALSIALVDDQRVVWARGFGYEDPAAKRAATAQTVYRVG